MQCNQNAIPSRLLFPAALIHPLKHVSEKAYLELVLYSTSTGFDMSDDEAVMKTLGSQSEEMARKLQGPQDRYHGLYSVEHANCTRSFFALQTIGYCSLHRRETFFEY